MAEIDVKCVKYIQKYIRSVYSIYQVQVYTERTNFMGFILLSLSKEEKSRTFPCLVARMSRACRRLVADVTGKSAYSLMEFGLYPTSLQQCNSVFDKLEMISP